MTLADLLNSDMTTIARLARRGFDWWVRELAELIPESLLPAGMIRRRHLAAWHRYEGGEVIPASTRGVDTVVIPRALCLARTLTLPRLPEADLRALIMLDADRIMPVPADSIVLGIRIAGPASAPDAQRDAVGVPNTVSVQVGALPLAEARRITDALAAAGLAPAHIGPLDAEGQRLDVDFAPALRKAGLLAPRPAVARFWWAVVAVLVLIINGTAILRDRQQVERLQALVDAQAPALNVVRRIEDRLQGNARQVTALDQRRAGQQPLRLMAKLGGALPPQAWVQRFEWDGKQLRLSGYAARGVNVVSALKASGAFTGVRANRAETASETETGRPFNLVVSTAEGKAP